MVDVDDIRNRFLNRILVDLLGRTIEPVENYQRIFPGHEDLIENEYRRVLSTRDGADDSLPGSKPEASLPFAERLARRFGPEFDLSISLEAEKDPDPDFAQEVAQRLAPEKVVERYRVKGEVARGGMGAILHVWDRDLRRNLAMKVIGGRSVSAMAHLDSRYLARFLEEAQVTSQLDHPGVVPVHELGLDSEGRVFFTMKLVDGQTLAEVIELASQDQAGWTQTRALEVILKVCDTMAYAHARQVIHRDLKPANVMVGQFGEVYVMDWGLAKVMGSTEGDQDLPPPEDEAQASSNSEPLVSDPESPFGTRDGTVLGTPHYMPPEQAEGRVDALSSLSDVYSVGAMLYQLLTGQPPFGAHRSPEAAVDAIRRGPPQAVHSFSSEVAAELEAICERAMARVPAHRYATMGELASDLRAFLNGRVVSAYENGTWAETKKWIRRNPGFAAALGAAVLLLFGGLATALVLREQAVDSANLAKLNEDEAWRQERLAKKLAEDVLSLSAFKKLEELEREAEALWPPNPDHIRAYRAWIDTAVELVGGLRPNKAAGDPGHLARLLEIRGRALPRPDSESKAGSRDPTRAHIEYLQQELRALQSSQEVRQGLVQVSEPPVPDLDSLPEGASNILSLARPLIDRRRSYFGAEGRGLAMVRTALERATDPWTKARSQEALAWALFATGQDSEARFAMATGVAIAPYEKKEAMSASQEQLEASIAGAPYAIRARIRLLEGEIARLSDEGSASDRWDFPEEENRWWHNQLANLVSRIEAFDHPDTGLWKGVVPGKGWGIARRLAFAAQVEERTVSGEAARRRWQEVLARMAVEERYAGLNLSPRLGLVPLGPDPDSKLEEFGHPLTGSVPERDPSGRIHPTEEMGLVFVLLPGATFWMGGQADDPEGRNYDPNALETEGPVHKVTVDAFFISKYEMSQGQWERFTGTNPSSFGPYNYEERWNADRGLWSALHPVERVRHSTARNVLSWMGCALPSEAQWEYACRAGTSTVFSTGDEPRTLRGYANLNDEYASKHGHESWTTWDLWLNDGYTKHAEIGSFAANPFGLHDMYGNVWEWCLDSFERHYYGRSPELNPVNDPPSARYRIMRGCSFGGTHRGARSSSRFGSTDAQPQEYLGLRPVLSLHASDVR